MEIRETHKFSKSSKKVLSKQQLLQLRKKQEQLLPHHGKPLGPHWLRELKIEEKRVYYVLTEEKATFVALSDKKSQQEVIDAIREELMN